RDGKDWHAVHAQFTSRNGRVDAPVIEAQAFGGGLHATLNVDARSDPVQVHLTLAGDDLDLGSLLASTGAATSVRGGKTEVRAGIASHGTSPHDWARHADGNVFATVNTASLTKRASSSTSVMTE